ncbi:hypothetical protein HGM15179_010932 [Zosterops borbonicus]|uniref:Uncharacterized protein n=1 Tax=Zosterops borbonicus TaxID=364589 RepID=A0A8K1GEE6_9PASS|nr:hypothetical protein HGM15179_010932 [Zosterops borbonicus]
MRSRLPRHPLYGAAGDRPDSSISLTARGEEFGLPCFEFIISSNSSCYSCDLEEEGAPDINKHNSSEPRKCSKMVMSTQLWMERFWRVIRGALPKWHPPGKAQLGCFLERIPFRGHTFQDILGGICHKPQLLPVL